MILIFFKRISLLINIKAAHFWAVFSKIDSLAVWSDVGAVLDNLIMI